ncbi:uncharacterized protein LOC144456808 [Phascolarctos cinereus]
MVHPPAHPISCGLAGRSRCAPCCVDELNHQTDSTMIASYNDFSCMNFCFCCGSPLRVGPFRSYQIEYQPETANGAKFMVIPFSELFFGKTSDLLGSCQLDCGGKQKAQQRTS